MQDTADHGRKGTKLRTWTNQQSLEREREAGVDEDGVVHEVKSSKTGELTEQATARHSRFRLPFRSVPNRPEREWPVIELNDWANLKKKLANFNGSTPSSFSDIATTKAINAQTLGFWTNQAKPSHQTRHLDKPDATLSPGHLFPGALRSVTSRMNTQRSTNWVEHAFEVEE